MWMFSVAWRNLWRHGRRTLITAVAMAVGVGLCMTMIAWTDGMYAEISRVLVDAQLGHVQVHHPDYPSQRGLHQTLKNVDEQLAALEALDSTRGATMRTFGFALVGGKEKSAGAHIIGIEPARERSITDLQNQVIRGRYLEDAPDKSVVVGHKLAETVEVDVGDVLVAVTQAADGSMGNDLYTIVGISRTGSNMKDESGVFMHLVDAQELLVLPDQAHEITLLTDANDQETVAAFKAQVEAALSDQAGNQQIQAWWEVQPQALEMLAMQDISVGMILSFVFLVAAFGIINTMMMSVFERTVEFGVLKAIGMRPGQMVGLIMAESFLLAVLASAIGLIIGGVLDYYVIFVGLDFSEAMHNGEGFSFMGVTLDPVMRGAFRPLGVIAPILGVFVVSLLASLPPAYRASRLAPVEAIRTE